MKFPMEMVRLENFVDEVVNQVPNTIELEGMTLEFDDKENESLVVQSIIEILEANPAILHKQIFLNKCSEIEES